MGSKSSIKNQTKKTKKKLRFDLITGVRPFLGLKTGDLNIIFILKYRRKPPDTCINRSQK